MSSNESVLPFIPAVLPIALPATVPVTLANVGFPGNRADSPLSALPQPPYFASFPYPGKGVVIRGVMTILQGAAPGTITTIVLQGVNGTGNTGTIFPVTMAAGQTLNIPFEYYVPNVSLPPVGSNNNYNIVCTASTAASCEAFFAHAWSVE
jgi:hypothetical protein